MIEEILKFAKEESVSVILLAITFLTFLVVSYWQWYKPRKAKKQDFNQQNGIFCLECRSKKESKFCKNCGKETKNNYVIIPMTGKLEIKGGKAVGSIKLGETSFSYLLFAFTVLLTILQTISVIPIAWYCKVIFMIFGSTVLFYLCLFNDRFRNRIISILSSARSHEQKF